MEQGHIDPQDPRYIVYAGRRMLRQAGAEDPPAPGPAPWAADLAGLGLPEDEVSKVDQYLRETWQPRVTQLEQDRPPQEAGELWDALQKDPVGAFAAFADTVYGEGAGERISSAFARPDPAAQPPPDPAYADLGIEDPALVDPTAQAPEFEIDPEWEGVKGWVNEQKASALYNEELARIQSDELVKSGVDVFGSERFHPFVVAADGDFDQAAQEFTTWFGGQEGLDRWQAAQVTPGEVEDPAPDDGPPPVVDAGPSAKPPIAKDYGGNLDSAIDDFIDEQRNQAPPAVGTV